MKKYLVLYYDGNDTRAAALPAPSADEEGGVRGFPESSNATLWGLGAECEITAVIGISAAGAEQVEDLELWINEEEVTVAA
jgi:hypothetical protein